MKRGTATLLVATGFASVMFMLCGLTMHVMAEAGTPDELIETAELIVYCTPLEIQSERRTGETVAQEDVVVYVQRMNVFQTLKGTAPSAINVSWEGIEPLPPAGDPVHLYYPGPLAQGLEYVLFLRRSVRYEGYETVGNWQGVYPLDPDGRLVALRGQGFAALGGMTVSQLRAYIQATSASSTGHLPYTFP